MLKTVSAALLAISVLAAPAMAASTAKNTAKDTAKTTAITKTTKAPAIKSVKAKASVMNANARMDRHHHFHRHFHKHTARQMGVKHVSTKHLGVKHAGAVKAHKFSKLSVKHATHAVKRG